MFDLKDIPLAKYSRSEDIANCVTHALGIPFCIIAAILLLRIQIARAPGRFIFFNRALCLFNDSGLHRFRNLSRAEAFKGKADCQSYRSL